MGRPGLRNWDSVYEARRGNRKRAENSGEVKISDILVQKISRSGNADEDYVEFLKLLYNYDKNSQSYINEHGNDGSYDEVEVEDKDEIDPQYKMFLANAKPDGRSYILNVNSMDEFPESIKYEKESECDCGSKCLCCKNRKDIDTQKDAVDEEILLNISSEDELKNRRCPRTDLGYDSNRAMGGIDVKFEPSGPTSQRNNGIMSRKVRNRQCGASKRQGKRETKIKSREEKMMEKGSRPVHVIGKEKASDVGDDYVLLLENVQCENWSLKASLKSSCNIEYETSEDDLEILYDSNDMLKKVEALTLQLFQPKTTRISGPSEFRKKVMDLLKKPYNLKEYKELWTYVNDQKPVERNMESRRGGVKSYQTKKMGKSYLEYYTDLKERLKEVANDERKKLKILRGFSFWLQNLTNAGAFKPWNDTEFLARVAESR